MKLENRFTVPVPVADAWKVLLDVERIAPCMPGATLTERNGDQFSGTVKVKVGPINLTYGGKAEFVSLDETNFVAVLVGTGKETRGTGTAKATVTCRLHDKGASTEVEVDTDLAVTGKPASFGRGVLADVSGKLVDQFAACLSEEILVGSPTQAAPDAASADPNGVLVGASAGSTAAAASSAGATTVTAGDVVGHVSAQPPTASPPSATTVAAGDVIGHTPPQTGASPTGAPLTGAPLTGTAASPVPVVPRAPRKPAEPINLVQTAGAPVLKRLAPMVAGVVALVFLIRKLRA